jgi:annexin A7/11
LRQIFLAFEEISGADIEFAIKRELIGSVETLNLTFSNCVKSKLDLAERSHDIIAGMGTKDKILVSNYGQPIRN